MTYEIKNCIIAGLPKTPYRNGVGAYEGIVDHSTATPEASDENEVRFYLGYAKKSGIFPHFFVDWDSISQIADYNYRGIAAGNGNPKYVHIELCETKDPTKFKESYKRYVWLTAYLLKKRNLGVHDGVTLVSHDWVSKHLGGTTHTDPIGYLASHGLSWGQHVANVSAEYNGAQSQPTQSPAPSAPSRGIDIGSTVTVQSYATNYADGKPIANFVRGSKHKVVQVKDWVKSNSKKAYLLADIMGWVLEQDLVESGVGINQQPTAPVPQTSGEFHIKTIPSTLWYYDKPDWNAKVGTVKSGTVLTVIQTLIVNGSKMYRLKSGTYITANPQYVKIV